MRAASAFAGAVAVHAAVLAALVHWMSRRTGEPAPRAPRAAEPVPIAPPANEPLDVVFLTEPSNPPAAASSPIAARAGGDRARTTSRGGGGDARLALAVAVTGGEALGAHHGEGAGRSPLMTMRGPELRLDRFTDALDAIAGSAELPAEVPITGRLANRPGDRGIINDKVATIDVAPDGTVQMHSKPDVALHFALPSFFTHPHHSVHALKRALADWYADPYASTYAPSAADTPLMYQAMPPCNDCGGMPDPAVLPPTRPKRRRDSNDDDDDDDDDGDGAISLFGIPLFTGRLDLTAYLARKTGVGDVYAARKLALLDSTRPERERRGAAFRAEQLDRSAILMRDNLAQLAALRDPADLHRALFELWDECAEGDGAEGQAGDRARGQVIGWIRAHLPAGSATAFTPDELAALDAHRTSVQHFAPY